MMKRILVVTAALALVLSGCGGNAPSGTGESAQTETASGSQESTDKNTGTQSLGSDSESDNKATDSSNEASSDNDASGETAEDTEAEAVLNPEQPWEEPVLSEKELYETLSRWNFEYSQNFSSWMTSIHPNADGSFDGSAYDFTSAGASEDIDMYNYNCEFHGRFAGAERIDPYTYEVEIGELSYETEPGTVGELSDGVQDIACEAYGLEGVKKLTIYIPGAPLKDIKHFSDMDVLRNCFVTRTYSDITEKEDIDYPEDLYFPVIWSEDTYACFISAPDQKVSGDNFVYLKNRAVFPGIHNESYVINADGTYDIRDSISTDRTAVIANICIPITSDMELVDYMEERTAVENEALAEYCAKLVMDGGDIEDLSFRGADDFIASYTPEIMNINGMANTYVSWVSGNGDDAVDYSARILQYHGHFYIYAAGISRKTNNIYRQALRRFMSSVTLTGKPEGLCNNSPDNWTSCRFGFVNSDFGKGSFTRMSLSFDEGEVVSGEDTDKLKKYGIDPDSAGDFEIVGDDGDYLRYDIADYCPVYEDVLYKECVYSYRDLDSIERIADNGGWAYGDGSRCMYLIFNEKNEVVFMFEMEDV